MDVDVKLSMTPHGELLIQSPEDLEYNVRLVLSTIPQAEEKIIPETICSTMKVTKLTKEHGVWSYLIQCTVPDNINAMRACLICTNATPRTVEFGDISVGVCMRDYSEVKYLGTEMEITIKTAQHGIRLVWDMTLENHATGPV